MYSPATAVAGTTATVTSGFSTTALVDEAAERPHPATMALAANGTHATDRIRDLRLTDRGESPAGIGDMLESPLMGYGKVTETR
jgi:hypothetical protein